MAPPARIPRLAWAFALLIGVLLFGVGLFVRFEAESTASVKATRPQRADRLDGAPEDAGMSPGSTSEFGNREEDSAALAVKDSTLDAVASAGNPSPVADRDNPPHAGIRGTIALILDDVGRRVETIDRFHSLGVPISYAVLPFESRTQEVAARVVSIGGELMVHLPMEGGQGSNPGPGALMSRMSADEVRQLTRRALAAVPDAVGVNNHMGSVVSADPALMAAVLDEVFASGLFFVDSRTSPLSVAFRAARARGVSAAERDVFLDADRSAEAIELQFDALLERAERDGAAIAIGHPYEETLEVLERRVPEALSSGYRFVPASYLLDSSTSEPE